MSEHKKTGDYYFNNKEYNKAIEEYTIGLLYVQDVKLYLNRNLAYMKICNYEEALNDAISAIHLDYNNAKTWGRMGSVLFVLGRYKTSRYAFQYSYDLEENPLILEQINKIDTIYNEKSDDDEDTEDEDLETNTNKDLVVNNEPNNNLEQLKQMFKGVAVNTINIKQSINNILSNDDILNKIKNSDFQNKVFSYKNNIIGALQDKEISSIISNILKDVVKS